MNREPSHSKDEAALRTTGRPGSTVSRDGDGERGSLPASSRSGRARLISCVCVVYLLSVLSGGCAHIQRLLGSFFTKPTMEFQTASVRDVSLGGLTLDLTWRVDNPNDVGVRMDELSYAFDIEGSRLASGVQPKGVEVAAKGGSTITLPFEVEFRDLADSVLSVLRKEVVAWKAAGSVGFDTPVGMISVPFEREGETQVPRPPQVELAGARVSNLSISGATFNIDLGLRNPNQFAVPLDRLNYSLQVAGADVASGVARPPRLPAGQQTTFSLPVRVSFASAGRAVYDAVQSGSTEIGIRGELASGPVDLPLDLSRRLSLR